MVNFTAVSVSEALRLPSAGTQGQVHSIYKDYLNIHVSGRLVALFRSGSVPIPFGIEVKVPESWLELGIRPHQVVSFLPEGIVMGETIIIDGLRQCPAYSCRPQIAQRPGPDELVKRLHLLYQLSLEVNKDGGISTYIGPFDPASFWVRANFSGGVMGGRVQQKVEALVTGILQNEELLIMEGVCGLLGVGPGLTPSGDDFLLGFFSGLGCAGVEACSSAMGTMAYHVGLNAPRMTTLVAAEYLKHGIQGMFHQHLVDFAEAFLGKDLEKMLISARQVLQLGHFSGGDILIGFVYGCYTALRVADTTNTKGGAHEDL